MSVLELLRNVPAVVWSAGLASLLTLLGVMASNASNTRRLIRQLNHDAEQKRNDRMATLHRDVYLQAAEEVAKAGSYLGKLSQIDPTETNLADGLSGLFAASAKVQLIAQPEASNLVGQLAGRYGELLIRLLQHVMPVHDLNSKIRLTSDDLKSHQLEAQRVLNEMRQANEAGTMTSTKWAALEGTFEFTQEWIDTRSKERDELWAKHFEANKQFHITLFSEMRELFPAQLRAMAALRSELGLETDMEGQLQRIQYDSERMDQQIRAMLEHLSESSFEADEVSERG